MITSDDDDLLFKSKSIDLLSLSPYEDMLDAIGLGLSFEEYFRRGTIPLPQLALFQKAWYLLKDSLTYRNNKENHPMDIDN
jgi:hypothetical protein